MLSLQLKQHPDYLLITAEGRLDALGAVTFEQETAKACSMSDLWVLDCGNLVFLSSSGIRSLMIAVRKLHNAGGELLLFRPGEQMRQVLEMSGLLNQFLVCNNNIELEEKINTILSRQLGVVAFDFAERHYTLKALGGQGLKQMRWQGGGEPLLLSLKELGMAVGTGCIAEHREQAAGWKGPFMSLPGFFFFSPDNKELKADYFSGKPDAAQGVYVFEALSVSGRPSFQVDISNPVPTPLSVVAGEISWMAGQQAGKMPPMIHFTGITDDNFMIQGVFTDCEIMPDNDGTAKFRDNTEAQEGVLMKAVALQFGDAAFTPALPDYQELASVTAAFFPPEEGLIQDDAIHVGNGRFWVYVPEEVADAAGCRLELVYEDPLEAPEHWDLIIREIYRDAGKVDLKQLHGGFSAKTFQVAAFSKEGRRMLPTVLKLGKVPVVEREEKNYKEYVQKYILNNSTTIMGAHYSGEWGGLRYNFLGINGPETRLKWLTHVYKERSAGELVPLFDRIFRNVLKPWYGQPRLENLRLWESHNPLVPFFPDLVKDAEKVLGISADREKLDCPYLGRSIMNPYWFLKHEWPKHLHESRLWYSSICHGDLNMQNILLDETDNIYVIDFSETHPRNVVSDFARLEPIFKIEMTRSSDDDLKDKLLMEEALCGITRLTDRPGFSYKGDDPMVLKAFEMVLKVREYARMAMIFEEDPLPYWLALLEWTLPYASYHSVPVQMQWHAAYSAGLVLEKVVEKM